jgi:hypothetical protein
MRNGFLCVLQKSSFLIHLMNEIAIYYDEQNFQSIKTPSQKQHFGEKRKTKLIYTHTHTFRIEWYRETCSVKVIMRIKISSGNKKEKWKENLEWKFSFCRKNMKWNRETERIIKTRRRRRDFPRKFFIHFSWTHTERLRFIHRQCFISSSSLLPNIIIIIIVNGLFYLQWPLQQQQQELKSYKQFSIFLFDKRYYIDNIAVAIVSHISCFIGFVVGCFLCMMRLSI